MLPGDVKLTRRSATSAEIPDDLIGISEAASIAKVSPHTVRAWANAKLFRSWKPGGVYRLSRREFLDWFAAQSS